MLFCTCVDATKGCCSHHGGEAMIKVRGEGVVRVQAPYISDKEIKNVVEFIKNENDAVNV